MCDRYHPFGAAHMPVRVTQMFVAAPRNLLGA